MIEIKTYPSSEIPRFSIFAMLSPGAIAYLQTQTITQVELDALALALEGQPGDRIAKHLNISQVAVRKRLGSIYKKLQIEGSTHGKLALLRDHLAPYSNGPTAQLDWGEAISVEQFHGREAELDQLQTWITDRARLIILWGMGGIGKTSLAIELVSRSSGFDQTIWRSLQDAPLFTDWASDILIHLGEQPSDSPLPQLLKRLRDKPHLLILDNWESILQSGSASGRYRPGYEEYGELLRTLGEVPHQSTLLITSREVPRQLLRLKGNPKVQALELPGLSLPAVQAIFAQLSPSHNPQDPALAELVTHCGGNPLTLKIVATLIQTVFHGDIQQFLQQGAIGSLRDIRSLINGQVDRLTKTEQDLLYWLAINRRLDNFQDLTQDFAPLLDPMVAAEALQALQQRSLLISDKNRYKLLPVVEEVLLNRLVKAVAQEITSDSAQLLHDHPLYKAQGDSRLRRFQSQMIWEPLLRELRQQYLSDATIYAQITPQIATYRHKSELETGYSVGNLINLLTRLDGIPLDHSDWSHLVIKQASFRKVALHQVNLSHSLCQQCAFTGSLGSLLTSAFHPATWFATGDADGRIVIWDLRSGEQELTWQAHENWVRGLCFTPDGQYLISASEDRTIKLWQASTGEFVRTIGIHDDWVRAIALSPDGKQIASASRDGTVGLWDLQGEAMGRLQGHHSFVRTVAFHPQGAMLASAGDDGIIRLWNPQALTEIAQLPGHSSLIQSITFSPDGKTLASAGWHDCVRLWDVESQTCLRELSASFIRSLSFSDDGQYLAGGGDQRQSQVWDLRTGESLGQLSGHTQSIQSVQFKPRTHLLATSSEDKTVILWDIPQLKNRQILRGYTYWVHSLALSPDGKQITSVGDDALVRRWNLLENSPTIAEAQPVMPGHQGRLWSTAYSPDGRWLATSGDDRTVKLWVARNGRLVRDLPHSEWVRSLCFSPDGKILATGSTDNKIRLWTPRLGDQPFDILEGHSNWIRTLAFTRDGKILWSSGDDGMIRGWHVQSGQCVVQTADQNSRIWSLAVNAQWLASGNDAGQVHLWHPETGKPQPSPYSKKRPAIRSIALHPTKPLLAVGHVDHVIRLWNLDNGDDQEFLGHEHWVRSLVFHPEKPFLFSGSQDGSIRQWQWQTGACLGSMMPDRPYEGMNITQLQGIKPAQMAMLSALGAVEG
jgi:WD40 repeat protein/DNA-binding CsgD family transcriptional regulator